MWRLNTPTINTLQKRAELLIVDSCPENIQVLRDMLDRDFQISSASSESEVLDRMGGEQTPDLILLDLMEPSGIGFSICSHLKENSKTTDIPIIFMSSRCGLEDEMRGLSLGAADFILKPFHMPLVKARINNHLNLKSKADMLERLAHIDSLTHIPNRRRFDISFEQEWRRAIRAGTFLAVLMIDLDNFKAYNDQHGHGDGDDCLRGVADRLSSLLQRPGDLIARYGGEEFVVLLPECSLKNAVYLAERMRAAVEYPPVQHIVTISIGCAAERPVSALTTPRLLKRADRNLYRAKSRGKNQVCGENDDAGTDAA